MLKPNDHVLEYVDAYLHDVLEAAEAKIVRQHCEECPICRVALDEARKRSNAFASLPAVETSGELIENTERLLDHAVARSRKFLGRVKRMSPAQLTWGTAAVIALLIASLHIYYATLSSSPYDLRVLGQDKLLAGAETSLRVLVLNRKLNTRIGQVPIRVDLINPLSEQVVHLARFETDERGTGQPRFRLPEWGDGNYQIRVAARVGGGEEVIARSVRLKRSWQLMVSPDKPVYQPGQVIRVRSLALRRPDLKPVAGSPVIFLVSDPKGNVIYRRNEVTSRYGIASAECPLADELIYGAYRIECHVGDTTSHATVEVQKYTLPRFKIAVELDRPYYQPGQMMRGTVQADYFFGKPISDASIAIEARPTGTGQQAVERTTLHTNKLGRAEFAIRAPDLPAGHEADASDARVALKVTVADSAGQEESKAVSRIVTSRPLRVEVIPEGGQLVAGVPNTVYLLTTYVDGRPARTHIAVSGFDHDVVTSQMGVATLEFTPQADAVEWTVRATDDQGLSERKQVTLPLEDSNDDFLLRTDKAVYDGGQTMRLTAVSRSDEPVFIDLIRDGQTVLADSIGILHGGGECELDLPPELFGTVELCAYRYGEHGLPIRKTRVIYIRPAKSLDVRIRLDRAEYRPGQKAAVDLQLLDRSGHPTPGAISLAAVDEAVYSVLDRAPGMERTFFTVEAELLKPVLDVYPWSPALSRGE